MVLFDEQLPDPQTSCCEMRGGRDRVTVSFVLFVFINSNNRRSRVTGHSARLWSLPCAMTWTGPANEVMLAASVRRKEGGWLWSVFSQGGNIRSSKVRVGLGDEKIHVRGQKLHSKDANRVRPGRGRTKHKSLRVRGTIHEGTCDQTHGRETSWPLARHKTGCSS